MAVEEYHDLAHHLLLAPGRDNPLGPHRPNAVHVPEASGSASMTSKTFSAKARTSFLA
jgi:hypothetical protein